MRGPARRWLGGTAIAAITLGLLLGATEAVLRWRDLPFPATWVPSETAMARFDPDLGWSYIPARSYVQEFGTERRPVAMHFDGLGARVGAPEGSRDPALPTLLFVGDSYTMGHALPYEETFVGLLDADAEVPYQIVNLGVQGYGTDQALLRLERVIGLFDARLVVYTFIDDHVLRNAGDDRRLVIPYARFLGTKPRFVLRRDGTLVQTGRPRRYEEMFQLHLWNWLRLFWSRHGPQPGPELTRALIRRMAAVSAAHGARLIVIHWRQAIAYPWAAGDVFEYEGEPVLRGLDLPIVDTAIDAPDGWDDWAIPGDYHPDARAHARVAALLKDEILRAPRDAGRPPEEAASGTGRPPG
jgi:hypothetical protein